MKRICVYCGSKLGKNPLYGEVARELGKYLAQNNIELVYGGSNLGLMGAVSTAVRENGGRVKAVMPNSLYALAGHDIGDELTVVDTMHERKYEMFKLSDAFIALPGGFGTLDEMFEMLTWGQLGHHEKPCGFLNIGNYYSEMLRFMDKAVVNGFVSSHHRSLAIEACNIQELMGKFERFEPIAVRIDGA